MCPLYERLERELHLDVSIFEANEDQRVAGQNLTMNPQKAVKKFHRPAAGLDAPFPEDVRPPDVLSMTLDYLFHSVWPHPLYHQSSICSSRLPVYA